MAKKEEWKNNCIDSYEFDDLIPQDYDTEEEYLEAIESLLLENDISSKHILRFLSLLSKNKERLDELLEQIYEQANLKK